MCRCLSSGWCLQNIEQTEAARTAQPLLATLPLPRVPRPLHPLDVLGSPVLAELQPSSLAAAPLWHRGNFLGGIEKKIYHSLHFLLQNTGEGFTISVGHSHNWGTWSSSVIIIRNDTLMYRHAKQYQFLYLHQIWIARTQLSINNIKVKDRRGCSSSGSPQLRAYKQLIQCHHVVCRRTEI